MNASDTEPQHPSTMPDSLPPAPLPPEPPPPASAAAPDAAAAPATVQVAPAAAPVAAGTLDLYRSALGPLNVDGYLAAFARFDANGRAGPVWNPAAALGTVGWMLFRRLWVEALVYAVLLLGLVVVLGWAVRSELLTPDRFWLAAAAVLLGAMALPGWLGTAWLHADIRGKLLKAAASAPTLHETRGTLSSNGVDRRRQRVFVLASLALLVLAVGVAALVQPMQPSLRAATGAVGPAPALVPKAPPAEPGPAIASPAATDAGVPVPVPAPAPLAITLPTAADAPPARPSAEERTVLSAASAEAPAQPPPPAQPPLPAESAKAAGPAAVPSALPAGSTAVAKGPAPSATAAPAAAGVAKKDALPAAPRPVLQQAPAKDGFAINVGLYAVPANADRAVARLQEVGLPTERDEVPSARGPLARVRVGPFDDPSVAEQTALQIRSLGLEAQVFMRCAHPARRSADARCRPTPADSGLPDSRAGG